MKYKVVTTTAFSHKKAIAKLTELVNDELTQGWEPVGTVTSCNGHYCQSLVKKRA